MAVLTDNGGTATYRIEIPATNGKTLVTEGEAKDVSIDGWIYGGMSLKLEGATYDQSYTDAPTLQESAPKPKVDSIPAKPVAPIKRSATIEHGVNPYIHKSQLDGNHNFHVGGEGLEEYALSASKDGDKVFFFIEDEECDAAQIKTTQVERIEMAIRLLSVTDDGKVRTAGHNNFFGVESKADETGERAIGAAINTLHATLLSLGYEKAHAKFESELKDWEQKYGDEWDEDIETPESANHARVLKAMCEGEPSYASTFRKSEADGELKSRWPFTYKEYEQEIDETDALEAIALKRINRIAISHYTLDKAKRVFGTFPNEVERAKDMVASLNRSAIEYARLNGIHFPAK